MFDADVQNGMAGQGVSKGNKTTSTLLYLCCVDSTRMLISLQIELSLSVCLSFMATVQKRIRFKSVVQTEFGIGVCLFSKDKVFLTYIRDRNERSL